MIFLLTLKLTQIIQRIAFDASLLSLTLLLNVSGADSQGPSLRTSVPLDESKLLGESPSLSEFNAPCFLCSWLVEETEELMADLDKTEAKSKSFPIESLVDSNHDNIAGPPANVECGGCELPFSRIILSAHICLLLYKIVRSCAILQQKCAKLLPRASFWLPIRVLKAFITLQGKTGLYATDSLQDSILALRGFEMFGDHALGDPAPMMAANISCESPHHLVR